MKNVNRVLQTNGFIDILGVGNWPFSSINIKILNTHFEIKPEMLDDAKEELQHLEDEAKHKNKLFYNSPLFHVQEVDIADNSVKIIVKPSCYFDYIALKSQPCINLSVIPLCANAVVVTKDNKIILSKRSQFVNSSGLIDVAAGFIDGDDLVEEKLDLQKAILRELEEEYSIKPYQIINISISGIGLEHDDRNIIVNSLVNLNLTSDELNIESNSEVQKFIYLGSQELEQFILSSQGIIVGGCQAALLSLGRQLYGNNWLSRTINKTASFYQKYNKLTSEEKESLRQAQHKSLK